MVLVISLASAPFAAETKKKGWTPGYDDPTVGVLGAKHPGEAPVNRNAQPPAPSAAPALPKVEAESPVVPGPGSGPVPLPAAPRADAHVEGAPVGGVSGGSDSGAASGATQPVNSFLAGHPVLSGLIAGLIGTNLGSILYGGPMMGDETAAMIGLFGRIVLVVLIAIGAVRLIWGLIGGSRDDDGYMPRNSRREPTLRRSEPEIGGRREPTFGRTGTGGATSLSDERVRRRR